MIIIKRYFKIVFRFEFDFESHIITIKILFNNKLNINLYILNYIYFYLISIFKHFINVMEYDL